MSGRDRDEGDPEPNAVVRALQAVTPTPIRRSFAIKFGLVLLLLTVSIGVIGLFATDRISAQTQENVESEFRTVANGEADIIEEWIERNSLSVELLSETSDLSGDSIDRITLTRERSRLSPDVAQIHVVDVDDGTPVVAGSTSLDVGTQLPGTERGWVGENLDTLRNLQADDVHVQHTYSTGSENVVGFLSPVSARQNRYLLIEVSTAGIRDPLRGRERAEGGFTQVVDAETNQVLIDELGQDELGAYADSEQALQPVRLADQLRQDDVQAGVSASVPATAQVIDQTYTVGYAPIEDTHWVVVTHAPRSSVFGVVQTISTFGLVVTVVAVLLIGATGTALGYSTSRAIDRLTRKTERIREGDLDVSFETSRIDNVGRLYDGFAEMRDSLTEQIEEARQARKEADVSRAEAIEMNRYLQEKAQEYSGIMQRCGAGDLTQRMSQDGENDAMDQIADEFNEMIDELEKTTGQLKSYVDEVEQAGAEVEHSAMVVQDASEDVADSIQTISTDAETQQERLRSIAETIDAVADDLERAAADHEDPTIDEALDRIREIAADIEGAVELSEDAQAETANIGATAEEQAAELSDVAERADELQRYAQPLRDILERFETEAEHEFVFSVGPTGDSLPAQDGGTEPGE
jgi:methyl-accepting chemotaxis protein